MKHKQFNMTEDDEKVYRSVEKYFKDHSPVQNNFSSINRMVFKTFELIFIENNKKDLSLEERFNELLVNEDLKKMIKNLSSDLQKNRKIENEILLSNYSHFLLSLQIFTSTVKNQSVVQDNIGFEKDKNLKFIKSKYDGLASDFINRNYK